MRNDNHPASVTHWLAALPPNNRPDDLRKIDTEQALCVTITTQRP